MGQEAAHFGLSIRVGAVSSESCIAPIPVQVGFLSLITEVLEPACVDELFSSLFGIHFPGISGNISQLG